MSDSNANVIVAGTAHAFEAAHDAICNKRSIVITDPKGELMAAGLGEMFAKNGYTVRELSLNG